MHELYRQQIIELYKHPHNFGELNNPDVSVRDRNSTCGDVVQIQLKLKDGQIDQIAFSGDGCAISRATASLLTDYLQHKNISEITKLTFADIEHLLQIKLNPGRVNCALLPLATVQKARQALTKQS